MNKSVLMGANTARGFVSFYDQILVPKAKYLGIIKGGPGTGKSTFMRKVGQRIAQAGYQLEELHCSSDHDSLDGIVVRGQGLALVDGTRPHIMEPQYPGCQDEIINLGAYWNQEALRGKRTEIMALSREIAGRYARVYRLLAAANQLSLDWSVCHCQALKSKEINAVTENLTAHFSSLPISSDGQERHLFASCLGPQGTIHYLETILSPLRKVYVLKDTYGCSAHLVLERLLAAAKVKGLFVEVYHCPLEPERIEHLVVEELAIGFSTAAPEHVYTPVEAVLIDLDRSVDLNKIKETSDLALQKETERQIINWAASELGAIKSLHDQLESVYTPQMDFAATEELAERTANRLSQLLESNAVPLL